MGSWKENLLAKLVTAYAAIFIALYPIGFLLIMIMGISDFLSNGTLPAGTDMFRLLRESCKEFFYPAKTPLWVSLSIFTANVLLFMPSYLALIRLNKFLKNILLEKPFIEENGRHLKFVGLVIVFITMLTTAINGVFMHVPSEFSTMILTGLVFLSFVLSFFNPYLVLGLFVVVLGEVIIRGVKMKEEIDLTV